MQFSVLGPLLATDDGLPFTPTPPKQRQLLALLILNSNRSVSVDACIEELWDQNPPQSAYSTLHTYVLHLRMAMSRIPRIGSLGEAKRILQTANYGYRLVVEPGGTDLELFEEHVRTARAALAREDDRMVSATLDKALKLWRGPALADIPLGPLLQGRATVLQEQRLQAQEQRIEADLRLGRHHELTTELAELTVRHPTHENLHAQWMLSLYRSGRAACALDAFHRLSNTLDRDLGISPSPRMRALYQAVLDNDESLDPPTATARPMALDLGRRVISQQRRVVRRTSRQRGIHR
ncbi:AfsR/SARP family transcriptional regulator [Streptomyces sp. NPDC001407]|uniref:AfsR/SARP family transcriptional regulator n=1 Tax=unclassified Streptomyces TaxID=2593676 RepID=UPI0033EB61B8